MTGAVITGWGISVPEKVVTNEELSQTLDTNDEWIVERTGIRERHVGSSTSQLAIEAGERALSQAGVEPSQVDMVLLATTTADAIVPATSAAVQNGLGLPNAGAFDLNAACSGFVYGLVVAHGLVQVGTRCILLIGSETLSRITDWDERTLSILVGDGAGAVVVEASDDRDQLLGWDLGADGRRTRRRGP